MMARPHIQSPPTLSSTPCRPQFTAGISLPHHQAPLSMTLSTLAPNRLRYTAPPPTVYPHHPESSPSLVSQPGELSECCQEQYSAHLAARPDVHFRAPVCGMLSMCERPMLEMEVSSHTGCGIQPGSTSPTACPLPGPPPHRLRYTAGLNLRSVSPWFQWWWDEQSCRWGRGGVGVVGPGFSGGGTSKAAGGWAQGPGLSGDRTGKAAGGGEGGGGSSLVGPGLSGPGLSGGMAAERRSDVVGDPLCVGFPIHHSAAGLPAPALSSASLRRCPPPPLCRLAHPSACASSPPQLHTDTHAPYPLPPPPPQTSLSSAYVSLQRPVHSRPPASPPPLCPYHRPPCQPMHPPACLPPPRPYHMPPCQPMHPPCLPPPPSAPATDLPVSLCVPPALCPLPAPSCRRPIRRRCQWWQQHQRGRTSWGAVAAGGPAPCPGAEGSHTGGGGRPFY